MQLVKWSFAGLEIPMVESKEGELYCTTQALCGALGVSAQILRQCYNNNKPEFDFLSVENFDAKEFFHEHKQIFNMKRVRGDIHLWSEDDMLTFAFFTKSPEAKTFRKELRHFIKEQARRDTVQKVEFMALLERVKNLELQKENVIPQFNQAASSVGKALRSFRGTTEFRTIH